MATQQEINDLVYDIKLAEQQQQLSDLFSSSILSRANSDGLYSFVEIQGMTSLSISYTNNPDAAIGLRYLTNLTFLSIIQSQVEGDIDVSRLTELTTLYLYGNVIDNVIGIGFLTNLRAIQLQSNNVTNIDIYNLSELESVYVNSNDLIYITRPTNRVYTKINTFDARTNMLPDVQINVILRTLADSAAYQDANGGVLLITVALEGGTNAAPTGDGLTAVSELTALGVTVTVNS